MLLVDTTQTGRSLQVRVDDHDLALILLLGGLVQDGRDRVTELDSTRPSLLGASYEQLGVLGGLDGAEDVGALWVSLVEVRDGRFPGRSVFQWDLPDG